jgi:hypothetical protein
MTWVSSFNNDIALVRRFLRITLPEELVLSAIFPTFLAEPDLTSIV